MNEQAVEEGALRRRRLGRSVFILPSLFTVGNIFCGYYAIWAMMGKNPNYVHAARAIGIAIILDSLDGYIARLTNSTSGFGLQLDSLADVITFGIAPSILVLKWGLPEDSRLALVAAFTFTICGAMRLARFNVQAGNLKHFVGLPIPAGGGAIAAIVYFFEYRVETPVGSNIMVAVVFFLALLMISTIRYSSLKHLALGKKSHLVILVIALLVALIVYFSKWTLLVLAAAYCLSGLFVRFYAFVRRKKPSEEIKLADSALPRS
jgi:CDP-diacylglycerol---serine O-phosphatidyltransferase